MPRTDDSLGGPTTGWNHNTHYHPDAVRHVTAQTRSALDVGCGEGLLTRRLHAAGVPTVLGLDVDAEQVARARRQSPSPTLTYAHGDVMTTDLGRTFDLVTCYAALHHLGLRPGLARLAELTAPGGSLVVVGLTARSTGLPAQVRDAGHLLAVRVASRRHHEVWEHGAPMADPVETHEDVVEAASVLTPGARVRRRLYWRYSLEWRRPPVSAGR